MKRRAVIATIIAAALTLAAFVASEAEINMLAGEVMLLYCLDRPNAHRVATDMFLHADNNSDQAIGRLKRRNIIIPSDNCRF